MSLYSETLCHKVCKFSTCVAAVRQPVEPPEQKAWRWAKFKALSMDLLTTDREETEPRVHTHTHTYAGNTAPGEKVQPDSLAG